MCYVDYNIIIMYLHTLQLDNIFPSNICIDDDVDNGRANGSKSAQQLPTGFACINQISSGSPAQSAVSSEEYAQRP